MEEMMRLLAATHSSRTLNSNAQATTLTEVHQRSATVKDVGSVSVGGTSGNTVPLHDTLRSQSTTRTTCNGEYSTQPTPYSSNTSVDTLPVGASTVPSRPSSVPEVYNTIPSADHISSPRNVRARAMDSPVSVTSSVAVPFSSSGDGLTGNDKRNYMRRMRVEFMRQ
ncbi:hypothetical protein KC19_VG276400, partial [Ceratodon purpureus]